MDVISAIKGRKSVRAFLDKPVPRDSVEAIIEAARFAPSGVNTQPWGLVATDNKNKLTALGDAIVAAKEAGQPENPDYHYYPREWFDPYKARRKACGAALYGALDIKMDEVDKRKAAWHRNYYFFGAPVGLILHIEDRLETGSWMDCALFLQNIMLAARGMGLETCPQAAMAERPDLVRQYFGLATNRKVICGIALGYEDLDAPVNQFRTAREPLETFFEWQ